jgi:hypothetical protein
LARYRDRVCVAYLLFSHRDPHEKQTDPEKGCILKTVLVQRGCPVYEIVVFSRGHRHKGVSFSRRPSRVFAAGRRLHSKFPAAHRAQCAGLSVVLVSLHVRKRVPHCSTTPTMKPFLVSRVLEPWTFWSCVWCVRSCCHGRQQSFDPSKCRGLRSSFSLEHSSMCVPQMATHTHEGVSLSSQDALW